MRKDWKELKPILAEAHRLLRHTFGPYIGDDTLGQFDVSNPKKSGLVFGEGIFGGFDAWEDRVSLAIERDPIGTAVHELLHANSYSDDWTPDDLGRQDDLISFRGFEIQWLAAKTKHVKSIYHRGLNEGVTEFFTLRAYRKAIPAYTALLPYARQLMNAIGYENVARAYFRGGYHELEQLSRKTPLNLKQLDAKAESALCR